MKLELLVVIITGFFVLNSYYDNYYMEWLISMKKYYHMILIIFFGFSFYIFVKKYPNKTQGLMGNVYELLRSMPLDKGSENMFSFNDITSVINGGGKINNSSHPTHHSPQPNPTPIRANTSGMSKRIQLSGLNNHNKRCVSESKKKYVAANQKWICLICNTMLDSTFEIDHIQRLCDGGTNHINNLRALCRKCHGNKTLKENFN